MKLRKILVSLLAVLMLVSSVQAVAFAGEAGTEDGKNNPNFSADVSLSNGDCVEFETLKKAELSITLTKDEDPAMTITAPVVYDEELETFSTEAYIEGEAMESILAELSARQSGYLKKSMEEAAGDIDESEPIAEASKLMRMTLSETEEDGEEEYDILEGYTVVLNGLPEGGHYTCEFLASVENGDTVIFVFEFAKALMKELLKEEYPDVKLEADTYIGLMDEIAKLEGFETYHDALLAEDYTEEEIAEEMELYIEMDAMLQQARSGAYPATLDLFGVLACECPVMEYYEIYHEYYKEDLDGNRSLVARVAEGDEEGLGFSALKGATGSYIRAEDYIQCEYEGRTYEYVNSYDSFTIYDEKPNWEKDIVTEFKLGDMMYSGMVLRYVEKEVPPDPEPVPDIEDDADVEPSEPEADSDQDTEVSPPTGDHTMIGIYIALIVTALAAVIVLLAYNKKKNKE